MPAVLSKFLDTQYGVLVPKTLPEVVHMMLHSGVERGTTVPDATYTMIRRDIMALPVDRRGKFRSTLRDQWGQKTKLWYDPDTLPDDEDRFVKVYPRDHRRTQQHALLALRLQPTNPAPALPCCRPRAAAP